MFNPIKKIFTYIQKNASSSTMFGNTSNLKEAPNVTSSSTEQQQAAAVSRRRTQLNNLKASTEPIAGSSKSFMNKARFLAVDDAVIDVDVEIEIDVVEAEGLPLESQEDYEDVDIERQIKTSIIDASRVKVVPKKLSPIPHLDDELADFADEPIVVEISSGDDLDEEYLEIDNFPSNEIIVVDADLNSSIASDNLSEDPLALDEFSQPRDSASITTNEEVDASGDLLWLKLAAAANDQISGSLEVEQLDQLPSSSSSSTSTHRKTKEDELRDGGGSDSGLGGETHTSQTVTAAAQSAAAIRTTAGTSSLALTASTSSSSSSSVACSKPLRSNLKRRLEDHDGMDLALVSSLVSSVPTADASKRQKRAINFDNVKIYYFPRQQGFSCVPTVGGCTLGMGARHVAFKTLTLAEHAAELRRAHRNQNQDMQLRSSSSDDTEESEEDYLSEGSGSDADGDSNGFLQPVTPKQRRALLKAAGVRKIDASEKIDCRDIRNSREVCGCSCREFCDPETCACSQSGIKCQVDRAMFPCGCTREACGNTVGRVEFNPTRVRTHYIHTVMRLDMEQRQGQQPSSLSYGSSTATSPAASVPHCYFMQTQSNYSSGYASPAYTPDGSVNYYQPQATLSSAQSSQQQLEQQQQQQSYGTHQDLHTPQYAIDSLDSNLFASGSTATPSYGELLTPSYQNLSYAHAAGASVSQLSAFSGAYHAPPSSASDSSSATSNYLTPATATPSAFSSCAVPSAPPFGNATTTASNAQYHHTNVLETTAPMTSTSTFLAKAPNAAATCASFASLSTPIASCSRLSQINDLLQHNRNTTVALVAVSESPGSSLGYAASRNAAATAALDVASIETPPIEEAQRNCIAFDELPPPLVNPTPIVAVMEQHTNRKLQLLPAAPQPRQALAATSGSSSSSSGDDTAVATG